MSSKFYFKLHPLQWQFEGDGTTVFRALELADGSYLVSWELHNKQVELEFTKDEVMESMALGQWVITNENGER